jgi:hypothetical protein
MRRNETKTIATLAASKPGCVPIKTAGLHNHPVWSPSELRNIVLRHTKALRKLARLLERPRLALVEKRNSE